MSRKYIFYNIYEGYKTAKDNKTIDVTIRSNLKISENEIITIRM